MAFSRKLPGWALNSKLFPTAAKTHNGTDDFITSMQAKDARQAAFVFAPPQVLIAKGPKYAARMGQATAASALDLHPNSFASNFLLKNLQPLGIASCSLTRLPLSQQFGRAASFFSAYDVKHPRSMYGYHHCIASQPFRAEVKVA
jgi:hypothetical protein